MKKVIRNFYVVSNDEIIKLNKDSIRLEIQFHNVGNDLVFINEIPLISGKYLILNNLNFNDITWYKIFFEKVQPIRQLAVIETFIVEG